MSALHPDLRKRLERDVIRARHLAEKGSAAAIDLLGVGEAKAPNHLNEEKKKLRVALRARSRQLRDMLRPDKSQETHHLMLEGGYEHWHQLLFTRFLAENNLLVMADGTPVTLEDCDDPEILRMEKAPDGNTLAMRYASRLLPQIFRPDDPLLRITFAPEHLQPLRKLVAELPPEIFQADDSLGWVYQFWRADEKDAVNKAGDKIDGRHAARRHPALHRALHGGVPAPQHDRRVVDREGRAARGAGTLGAFRSVDYLRCDRTTARRRRARSLAGRRPCASSGCSIRAAARGISSSRCSSCSCHAARGGRADARRMPCAPCSRENLHGLELDARCTQIAAFAVAFAAWNGSIGRPGTPLPPLNIACSGLGVVGAKEEWLAGEWRTSRLRFLIGAALRPVQESPDTRQPDRPRRGSATLGRKPPVCSQRCSVTSRRRSARRSRTHELGVTAAGIADAVDILSGAFHLSRPTSRILDETIRTRF